MHIFAYMHILCTFAYFTWKAAKLRSVTELIHLDSHPSPSTIKYQVVYFTSRRQYQIVYVCPFQTDQHCSRILVDSDSINHRLSLDHTKIVSLSYCGWTCARDVTSG